MRYDIAMKHITLFNKVAFAVFCVIAFLLIRDLVHAQVATPPIFNFPAVTQPNCTASWDVTNKLLVTNCSIAGVALPPISYNPRQLEGNSGGGFTITFGGITILYQHNLATDALKYQIGTGTTIFVACAAVIGAPTGSPACPAVPF